MGADGFKSIRDGLGLSQQQMGEKIGYATKSAGRNVRRFESGETKVPSYIAQLMICYRDHN